MTPEGAIENYSKAMMKRYPNSPATARWIVKKYAARRYHIV